MALGTTNTRWQIFSKASFSEKDLSLYPVKMVVVVDVRWDASYYYNALLCQILLKSKKL